MCEIKKVKKRYKTEVLKHSKLIKLNITSLAHLNNLFFYLDVVVQGSQTLRILRISRYLKAS